MSEWRVRDDATLAARQAFGNLDAVFALQGRRITSDVLSEVILVEVGELRYYIKRYNAAGKGLRRYIGRPRIKAEWQNLRQFERWGIATAPTIAFGLERQHGAFVRGALITQELRGTEDLAQLASANDPRLRDRAWVMRVIDQLAAVTRTLHAHHFTHNDLKWRNLLVDEQGSLYLIDCPTGTFWWGPLLRHRIVKDLACLDKVAKCQLSRTQRLRFYLAYCGRERLGAADKARIRQVLQYFEGRE